MMATPTNIVLRASVASRVLTLLFGLVIGSNVHGQSMSERLAFVEDLNDSLALSVATPIFVEFPSSWLFPAIPSGCIGYGFNHHAIIDKIDGGSRIRITTGFSGLDDAGSVPFRSHPVVCDLNAWLFRLLTEAHVDAGTLGYDDPCEVDVGSQTFWIAENDLETHVPNLKQHNWFAFPFYEMPIPDSVGEEIVTVPLFVDENDSEVRWIVKRGNGDTLRAKRATGELTFNLTAHADLIDKAGVNLLTGIEFVATIPEPDPNHCHVLADETAYGTASVVYTVRYVTTVGGTESTVSRTFTFPGTDAQQSDSLFNFLNWDNPHIGETRFEIDGDGFVYLEFKPDGGTTQRYYLPKFRTKFIPAEVCSMVLPFEPGVSGFAVDSTNGEIVFLHGAPDWDSFDPGAGDVAEPIACFATCELLLGTHRASNVIAASARTFINSWPMEDSPAGSAVEYDPEIHDPYENVPRNRFETGEDGIWRPRRVYAYRSRIKPGDVLPIYADAGVFVDEFGSASNAFTQLVWGPDDQTQTEQWLNVTTITKYAPSGEAVEERDALGIPSSAVLGYDDILPIAVAKNAEERSIAFESFEQPRFVAATPVTAHSGLYSYHLPPSGTLDTIGLFTFTQQMEDKGLLIKLWAKRTYNTPAVALPFSLKVNATTYNTLATAGTSTETTGEIHHVAQTGEWSLYSLRLASDLAIDTGSVVILQAAANGSTESVWVDDVRVQPVESQVVCYTYDPRTLRLVAQFDDQHFGRFYRYNGEGKLIRTLVETERGVKTVAETYYHTPLSPRETTQEESSIKPIDDLAAAWETSTDEIRLRRLAVAAPAARLSPGLSQQFELLGLNVGATGASLSFLGGDAVDVEKIDSIFSAAWARVEAIDIDSLGHFLPGVEPGERHDHIEKLLQLDQQLAIAASELTNESADREERLRAAASITALRRQRLDFIRDELNLDNDGAGELYEGLGLETPGLGGEGNSGATDSSNRRE